MRWDLKGEILGQDSWNESALEEHVSEAFQLGKTVN